MPNLTCQCGYERSVSTKLSGKTVHCPQCSAKVTIAPAPRIPYRARPYPVIIFVRAVLYLFAFIAGVGALLWALFVIGVSFTADAGAYGGLAAFTFVLPSLGILMGCLLCVAFAELLQVLVDIEHNTSGR